LYTKSLKSTLKKNNISTTAIEKRSIKNSLKSKKIRIIPTQNIDGGSESDSEKQLANFNKLFAKKFPLNIFVGSDLNLSNSKLKVYHGKYIRTFIVNNSMKRDLTCKIQNKNPYEEKIKGNFVYFEEKPKNIFEKLNSTVNRSARTLTTSKKTIFPKIIPQFTIESTDTPMKTEVSDEKSEKLDHLKKMYGIKHFKENNEEKVDYNKTTMDGTILSTKRFLEKTPIKKKKESTISYFKNQDFYYSNTDL